jgi:hypothetical protein
VRAYAGLIALVVLLAPACSDPGRAPTTAAPAPSSGHPRERSQQTPGTQPAAPILTAPSDLATALTHLDRRLRKDVLRWRAEGAGFGSRLAPRVSIESLRQQEIYRYLAGQPAIARQVAHRVGPQVKQEMGVNLGAARDLNSLVSPVQRIPNYQFAPPVAPDRLRQLFVEAQGRYGVPWSVLAAINFVESKFGRILGPSSSGALGPMQFLPSTFALYGEGNIKDPRDSILAAANYLHSSGAPDRLRPALFAYNRARAYVDAILRYARQMRSNRWSFWVYYDYQVFVSTTRGSVRLTGPGTAHPDHTPGRPAPT